MRLAKGADGRIGRQIPGQGMNAKVVAAPMAERRGDVYLSTHSIEADQAYYSDLENTQRALNQAKRIERSVRAKADKIREERQASRVRGIQSLGSYSRDEEKLRRHFARKLQMGETDQVVGSILPANPADFSESGANPQYVPGERMTGGEEWRADFRQHLITGSPLTRDGVFGPQVTDFERFVKGVDVNQTDVVEVVGGTMLGRMGDEHMFQDVTMGSDGSLRVTNRPKSLGFDWSWDGLADAFSSTASQTVDNVIDDLPGQLAQELQHAITGGGTATTSGNTITVQRPVTGATTTLSQTLGLPKWALYGGLGLLGIGVTFMMIKAVKS
jgi:hypothetical protein